MSDPERAADERPETAGSPAGRSALERLAELSGVHSQVSLPVDDESASALIDPSSVELGPERRTEQYQLLGEVARGGVGIILRGHDVDLGRDVAMKVLRPDHADRPSMIQRFIEEAQIGGQLQHPGIVPVYELGVRADGRPYFTMKLIKGRTFSELLKESRGEAGARRRFLSIFVDICQTMAYAHSKGVVHRDLKPSNVMVGAFGEVLVVDWGLAKVLDRSGDSGGGRAAQELASQVSIIETIRSSKESGGSDSLTGSVLGTPSYMAPEQARGEVERVDQRTDVFALGCLLCELLTGAPPYTGKAKEVLLKAASASLGEAHAWLDGCGADPELVSLAKACLAPAMDARPQHAGAVAQVVERYLGSLEERAQAAVVEAAEARQKRRLTVVGALAVLLLGAGLWWVTSQRAERTRRTDATIERCLGEATVLAAGGDLRGALDALGRGDEVLASGSPSPDMRTALASHREQLEAAVERERFLADLAALATEVSTATEAERSEETPADAQHALRLESLRERDRAFAEAFGSLGVDLLGLPLADAVTAVRDAGAAVELCQALDAWAAIRRGLGGLQDAGARHLLQVAVSADPHEGRMQLRQALLTRDAAGLRALAEAEDPARLSALTGQVLAAALIQLDAHEQAVTLLRGVLREHRGDHALQLLLASALKRLGRLEEAVGPLQAALALEPSRLLTLLELGDAYLAATDLAAAEAVLEDAAALHPDSGEPLVKLATVQLRQERFADSLATLERAVAADPSHREARRRWGLTSSSQRGLQATEATVRAAVAAHQDDPEVLLALAWAMAPAAWATYEDELAVLERVLELQPERVEALGWAARLRAQLGDFDGALLANAEAIRLDPDDLFLHTQRGRILRGADAAPDVWLPELRAAVDHPAPVSDAVNELQWSLAGLIQDEQSLDEGVVAALPDDVWTLLGRSDAAFDGGDLEGAESFARQAVARAPDLWPARWQLAFVLGKRPAKRDAAIAAYLELIRLRPDHLFARTNIGMRYLEAGELDQALAQFGRAVGTTRHPVRLAHLGEVLWRLDRQEDARRLFAESRWRIGGSRSREYSFAYRTIAYCLAIDPESPRSQLLEAERMARRFVDDYDSRDDAHEVLGLVLYRLGELQAARTALVRSLELQPDGARARTAFLRALVELSLGERDEGLRWLQHGAQVAQDTRVADPFVLQLVQEAGALMGR